MFLAYALCLLLADVPMPEPLTRMLLARERLANTSISCIVTGGYRLVGSPVQRYSFRTARNGDSILDYEGDLDGVLFRDDRGEPVQCGVARTVRTREMAYCTFSFGYGGSMSRPDQWEGGHVYYAGAATWDPRAIGLCASWDGLEGRDTARVVADVLKDAQRFDVERNGSIHRVTAHFDGGRTYRYDIDEAKGWNPVCVTASGAGRTWESRIDLARYGDVWFPERVVTTCNGEQRTEFVVSAASFDDRNQPERFGPEDAGFESGMQIHMPGDPPGTLIWDGSGRMPFAEYQAAVKAGTIETGPIMKAMFAGGYVNPDLTRVAELRASVGTVQSFVSQWARHVSRFNNRHGLNAEQREATARCLRRAEDAAAQYLRTKIDDFAALVRKRAADEITLAQRDEAFARLRKPVDDIYQTQLCPCLERVPTKEQAEAARQENEARESRARPPAPPASSRPQSEPQPK